MRISACPLGCAVDFTELPASLEVLQLSQCQLIGSANLSRLPEGMLVLDISHNSLVGEITASAMPRSLRTLRLRGSGIRLADAQATALDAVLDRS